MNNAKTSVVPKEDRSTSSSHGNPFNDLINRKNTPKYIDSDLGSFADKLVGVESKGSYTALNKGSGAYGRYQFIPSTLAEYARKTNQTIDQAKTPKGQDIMFAKFTEDNMNSLKKMKIPTTELNMWIAHNQGLGGASAILKGKKLSPIIKKNIASNIPKGMEPTAENYINYWSKKFNA